MEIEKLYALFSQNPLITTDTRNIPAGSLYFALTGDRFDGNTFAAEALQKGAAYTIIDKKEYLIDHRTILVENVLKTLQNLAQHHRRKLNIPLIAITGTNGKTTTKELVHAVLSQKYKTISTKGNLNNHIGVPLTLLSMTNDTEIGVVEMGANHQNEIKELCEIAEPNYGLITNIGKAHLEGFGGYQGVIKTKNEMYDYIKLHLGRIFYNSDDELLSKLIENYSNTISYGLKTGDTCKGEIIASDLLLSLKVSKVVDSKSVENCIIKSKLFGSYNASNILAACSIGINFNITLALIKDAIEDYTPTNNRSQHTETSKNKLLLDCYNANPSSTEAAIRNFNDISAINKTIILGDMLELGAESIKEHEKILDIASAFKHCKLIVVGDIYKDLAPKYNIEAFSNSDELKEWIVNHQIIDSFVLIKGSRGIKLEKIVEVL